jgi:hypothetical protein
MVGELLGSHAKVFTPGEYLAFYATEIFIKRPLARIPSLLRNDWFEALDRAAVDVAVRSGEDLGADVFCDATPWNLIVADSLAQRFPNALFVLCLRHPAGVIQSLERSFRSGFLWAGADDLARAKLYASVYVNVPTLPPERTLVFDYDAICGDPENFVPPFIAAVANALQVDTSGFDLCVLARSHAAAPVGGSGPPIATVDDNGQLQYQPRESYDPIRWIGRKPKIDDVLAVVMTLLAVRFPGAKMMAELV